MRKSSRRWLNERAGDIYVKQAQKAGYRSRAVYKLAEIDARDRLFQKSGMRIVDLGAAPGGWSQWAQQRLHGHGIILAVDILPMEPLPCVTFIQGDFREQNVFDALLARLESRKVDLVMSDMAPNISGMKAVDQPRAMLLAELARDAAFQLLAPGGMFLSKVFQGDGIDSYIKELRAHFDKVVIRKPKASRSRSREVYVLGRHYAFSEKRFQS
ncbi:MAG: 23S rRNA (uridine(2552)-2'-O)-methyltransferase RlmE [Gammaproteobacteria bacterium]|nr:23S rRNA (uridine(2552)-2'-O)-methyltransferase RlmE [Gammaproteobacteria bacterium]